MTIFSEVAIPVPLGQSFSYRVPERLAGRACPGARVLVEFGRRKVLGVVLRSSAEPPPVAADRIKDVLSVLDAEPVVDAELLAFLEWLADYYLAPIGEVLRLALPAVEREQVRELERQGDLLAGESPGTGRTIGGREQAFARATAAVEPPGELRGKAAAVLALLRASGELPVTEIVKRYGNARPALARLAGLGLVDVEKKPVATESVLDPAPPRDEPPELNDAQRAAVARICGALDGAGAATGSAERAFLLFGVTGSGKTEIYMHAITRCRERGRGALVLVPEIALTPQLVGRFRARFGDEVGVLHSGLADAERHRMWRALKAGSLRIAVGARSALFAPVGDLGLVVVDEEHDGSFKQEEGVRYHARDMALLRAHRAGAVAVLGSATPSLESTALVASGKLVELALPERATRARLPEVEIVDLRRMGPGRGGQKLLSLPLERAIEATLAAGEQCIVFLNRRGFAPAVVCDGCGVVRSCGSCSVALTFHKQRGGRLRCHTCDSSVPLPTRCPECGHPELVLEGLGTEQLEAVLSERFPAARVARLDRDVGAGTRGTRILERVRSREIDILVGTQMVTKGHDLPGVTLVGVVNADAALSIPDFRAGERGFQLLVQVAGRAGRHDRSGRVLIQTRNPEHPAVRCAAAHDVRGFLARELGDRREVGYPPFTRLALVRLSAVEESDAARAAARIAAWARGQAVVAAGQVQVLGPAPAPIARQRNRFRFRVMLRSTARGLLHRLLGELRPRLGELDRKVRAVIDVDPVSML